MTNQNARSILTMIFGFGFTLTIVPLVMVQHMQPTFQYLTLIEKILCLYLTPMSIVVMSHDARRSQMFTFFTATIISGLWIVATMWETWTFYHNMSWLLNHPTENASITEGDVAKYMDDFIQKTTFLITAVLAWLFKTNSFRKEEK
jgi:hypothetical protein